MKPRIALIIAALAFIQCLLLAQPDHNSLLWKVSKENLAPSYLYGTMHVKDDRVFDLIDSLLPAMQQAQAFALEVHPDSLVAGIMQSVKSELINSMLADDEEFDEDIEELLELLENENYRKLFQKYREKYGIDLGRYNFRSPYFIEQSLDLAAEDKSKQPVFLDLYLYSVAKNLGKTICGLEVYSTQPDISTLNNDDIAFDNLDALVQIKSENTTFDRMLSLYLDQDIRGLDSMYMDESFVSQEFRQNVIIDRNRGMAASLDSLIQEAPTFAAVGAAHLAGDEGMLQILRERGYSVTPVLSGKTRATELAVKVDDNSEWYKAHSGLTGYSVEFPVEPYRIEMPFSEIDIEYAIDLSTGISYYTMGIPISSEFILKSPRKTYKGVIEYVSDRSSSTVWDEERLDHDDMLGLKRVYGRTYPQELTYYYLRDNRFLYILGVMPYDLGDLTILNQEDVQRFFNSFETFDVETRAPVNFTLGEGGFSASFPGTPRVQPNPYFEEGTAAAKTKIVVSTDVESNTSYYIMYVDLASQTIYTDDSTMCRTMIGEFMAGVESEDYQVKEKYIDGFLALTSETSNGLSAQHITAIVRDWRIYFIMAEGPTDRQDDFRQFLESFRFNEYGAVDWKNFEHDSLEISLLLPEFPDEKLVTTRNDDGYYAAEFTLSHYLTDKNSGTEYQWMVETFSEFYSIPDTGLYSSFVLDNIIYGDSLISVDTIELQGRTGYDYLVEDTEFDIAKRYKVVLDGNRKITLITAAPKNLINTTRCTDFINSLQFKNPVSGYNIFENKTAAILQGLLSLDSIEHENALTAFQNPDAGLFEPAELVAVLFKKHRDDTTGANTTSAILSKLREVIDSSSAMALIDSFDHLPDDAAIRFEALRAIAEISGEPVTQNLVRLLVSTLPQPEYSWSIWQLFDRIDDYSGAYEPYAKTLLTLVTDSAYGSNALWLVNRFYDNGLILQESLIPYRDLIVESFRLSWERCRAQYGDGRYTYSEEQLQSRQLEFLMRCPPDKEVIHLLKYYIRDVFATTLGRETAVRYLVTNDQEVDTSIIREIVEDPYYHIPLYNFFRERDQLAAMPRELRARSALATSDLSMVLEWEDVYPDELVLVDSVLIGNDSVAYAFRISWSGDYDEHYFGFAGNYDIAEGAKFVEGYATGTEWTEFNPDSTAIALRQWLEYIANDTIDNSLDDAERRNVYISDSVNMIFADRPYEERYASGALRLTGGYRGDQAAGHWYYFDALGKFNKHLYYDERGEHLIYEVSEQNVIERQAVTDPVSDYDFIATSQNCRSSVNNEEALKCTRQYFQQWFSDRVVVFKEELDKVIAQPIKLKLLIGPSGNIGDVEVIEGAPSFTLDNVLWSLRHFPHLSPALKNNQPVACEIEVEIDPAGFRLNDDLITLYYQPPIENKQYNKGVTLLHERKFESAEKAFEKALEQDPDHPFIFGRLGQVRFFLGDKERALADLNTCLRSVRYQDEFYAARGEILYGFKRFDDALEDIDRAIEINPDDPLLWNMRATTKLAMFDFDGAMADIDNAILIEPYDIHNYSLKASIHRGRGEYDEAVKVYNNIILLDSTYYQAYINRGLIIGLELGGIEEAIANFEYVAAHTTDSTLWYTSMNNIGIVYSESGEYGKSIPYFRKSVPSKVLGHVALNNLGYSMYMTGEKEKGLNNIEASLMINNKNAYAYRNRALIEIAMGDIEAACLSIEYGLINNFTEEYGDELLELKEQHCTK